ncbi:MAG: PQQ-binding-like beta-propeller repeat protein [Cyclobacteriaceae bacterium]
MKFTLTAIFFYCLLLNTLAQQKPDFNTEPKVQWRFKTNAPIFSSPIISDGVAYFGGLDSTLYALDVRSGDVKWKIKTSGELRSNVAIEGDKLYLMGGNGLLSCLDKKTGKAFWRKVYDNNALYIGERRYDFADYFHSSPLIHNGVIYLGSSNNQVFALSADSGETLWSFKANDIIHNKPVVVGDKLFIGSFDGHLYALHLKDGRLLWKFKSVGQQYFPKGEMQGSPVAGFGSVFIGSRDFNFYALDTETGQGNWNMKFPKGWAFAATVKDTVLFLGTAEDRLMMAIDARNGRELWKVELKFHIFGQSEFSSSLVYVPTIWGKLYALDRKTGATKWTFTTDGYKTNHLKYFKPDDTYRDDIYTIFKSSIDLIKAEYSMGGIFSTPAIDNDIMVITTTEGTVYGLKK